MPRQMRAESAGGSLMDGLEHALPIFIHLVHLSCPRDVLRVQFPVGRAPGEQTFARTVSTSSFLAVSTATCASSSTSRPESPFGEAGWTPTWTSPWCTSPTPIPAPPERVLTWCKMRTQVYGKGS